MGCCVSPLEDEELHTGIQQGMSDCARAASDKLSEKGGIAKNKKLQITEFPPAQQEHIKKIQKVPGSGKLLSPVLDVLNHVAEETAGDALPAFDQAIRAMSLKEGRELLRGESDTITRALAKSQRAKLIEDLKPICRAKIDKTELGERYNSINGSIDALLEKAKSLPFFDAVLLGGAPPKLPPLEAEEHVATAVVDAMFVMMAKHEFKLRTDSKKQGNLPKVGKRVFTHPIVNRKKTTRKGEPWG